MTFLSWNFALPKTALQFPFISEKKGRNIKFGFRNHKRHEQNERKNGAGQLPSPQKKLAESIGMRFRTRVEERGQRRERMIKL